MARRKKKKRKGSPGNGLGAHAETSPMGHATITPSREEIKRREEKRIKQQGWAGCMNLEEIE
jgi:hypothetical protein